MLLSSPGIVSKIHVESRERGLHSVIFRVTNSKPGCLLYQVEGNKVICSLIPPVISSQTSLLSSFHLSELSLRMYFIISMVFSCA